jgi:hypothetical protein
LGKLACANSEIAPTEPKFLETCLSHLRIAEIIVKGVRPDEVHNLITYERAQINRKKINPSFEWLSRLHHKVQSAHACWWLTCSNLVVRMQASRLSVSLERVSFAPSMPLRDYQTLEQSRRTALPAWYKIVK